MKTTLSKEFTNSANEFVINSQTHNRKADAEGELVNFPVRVPKILHRWAEDHFTQLREKIDADILSSGYEYYDARGVSRYGRGYIFARFMDSFAYVPETIPEGAKMGRKKHPLAGQKPKNYVSEYLHYRFLMPYLRMHIMAEKGASLEDMLSNSQPTEDCSEDALKDLAEHAMEVRKMIKDEDLSMSSFRVSKEYREEIKFRINQYMMDVIASLPRDYKSTRLTAKTVVNAFVELCMLCLDNKYAHRKSGRAFAELFLAHMYYIVMEYRLNTEFV